MIVYTKETTTDSTGDVVTFSEVEVQTSGGLTKTKVTLAELKQLCTEENIGVLVEVIPKSIELPYTLPVSPITRAKLGDNLVIACGITSIFNITVGTNEWTDITVETILISKDIVVALSFGLKPSGSATLLNISTSVNDTNFDFYVYK